MAVNDLVRVSTAILSVYDKTGIKHLASELVRLNPKIIIISSGGTYRELEKAVPGNVIDVSSYTGFPEMPGGLVKTLHPKLHGGILGSGAEGAEAAFMQKHWIEKIDIVVVNLYPFQNAASGRSSTIEDARTNIDIGGVSLIEAGCKNFLRVAVITEPPDYEKLLGELKKNGGQTSLAFRLMLAKKGLAHISSYLQAISGYFEVLDAEKAAAEYLGGQNGG
ncbi:hypothetical protein HYV82_05320 [Candidatus Woesearchaeota archaeon]|nr:hypothetical protein [Candidatus Woesearchaeota archaeon]